MKKYITFIFIATIFLMSGCANESLFVSDPLNIKNNDATLRENNEDAEDAVRTPDFDNAGTLSSETLESSDTSINVSNKAFFNDFPTLSKGESIGNADGSKYIYDESRGMTVLWTFDDAFPILPTREEKVNSYIHFPLTKEDNIAVYDFSTNSYLQSTDIVYLALDANCYNPDTWISSMEDSNGQCVAFMDADNCEWTDETYNVIFHIDCESKEVVSLDINSETGKYALYIIRQSLSDLAKRTQKY